jgi:hypothetical protein
MNIENINFDKEKKLLTTSTGSLLRLKSVNRTAIQSIVGRMEKPKVPTYHNEDLGRDEENPNHPDYIAALDKYNQDVFNAVYDFILLLGVEIVKLGENCLPENDDDWAKEFKFLGIIKKLPSENEEVFRNRIDWIKYYILSGDEFEFISDRITETTGVKEEDVKKQGESFRGND